MLDFSFSKIGRASARDLPFLVSLLALLTPALSLASGFNVNVKTVAGSGSLGDRDGTASNATFVYPIGVASDRRGGIYIADAGSQRIRLLRNGRVTTVAGSGQLGHWRTWVDGGYRNGTASQAQFNFPSDVAVDSLHRVFVADTDNRCIRMISASGMVSTYAGAPTREGAVDGPRGIASFSFPLAVATGANGEVYVADYGNGFRKIAPDGNVSTIFKTTTAFGVAVSPSDAHVVIGTDGIGLIRLVFNGGAPTRITGVSVGHPLRVAAINDFNYIFSDGQAPAINYLEGYSGAFRTVAGSMLGGQSNDYAGYRNGRAAGTLFSRPGGLAVSASGDIIVADAGNRRIRAISPLNLKEAINPFGPNSQFLPSGGVPHIVLVADSYSWATSIWDDSIERRLQERLGLISKSPVDVDGVTIQAVNVSGAASYIENLVAEVHPRDGVVLLLDNYMIKGEGISWEKKLIVAIKKVQSAMGQSGMWFTVVYHPSAQDLAWSELSFPFTLFTPSNSTGILDHDTVDKAIQSTGVPYLDLWPAFIRENLRPNHRPLFGTTDVHFSQAGRELAGNEIAAYVAQYLKK